MNAHVRNKPREYLEDPLAIAEHRLKDIHEMVERETRVREQLARRGYRLMNRVAEASIGLCTQNQQRSMCLRDCSNTWIAGNARGALND